MQDSFNASDGDAWYERNKGALGRHMNRTASYSLDIDLLTWLAVAYISQPNCIVDIGGSDGWRAARLHRMYQDRPETHVVELSYNAVLAGTKMYPSLVFHNRSAEDTGLRDGQADLCVVSYCFHWLDRRKLLPTVTEIDRILQPNGHLLIADFAPDYPTKVPYKHREGLWTWKLPDYGALFTSTGLYHEVARMTYDHDDHRIAADVESHRRGMVVLLQKREGYLCV